MGDIALIKRALLENNKKDINKRIKFAALFRTEHKISQDYFH